MVLLPVSAGGQVEPAAVDAALEQGVALLSVMWVNNETGAVQDVVSLAEHADQAGVPFHTDAVQALGKLPCTMADAPITLLTLSGHKIGALKGAGALIVRDKQVLEPLLHGGGQQEGVRPGTENVAGAVGLGVAVKLASAEQTETEHHTRALRDDLERRVIDALRDATVNGRDGTRAPHISSIAIPGADSNALLMQLDVAGIACSAGSACATGTASPSHVLMATGLPDELASASVRFSFGHQSREQDVDRVIEVLPDAVQRVRTLVASLAEGA
jgi:cysteine desulfurase